MCSISGLVHAAGIEAMVRAQRHRAPDEAGLFQDDILQLAMGRLRVIDLKSPGLAPYREDEFVLAYNGEIFNYLELRKRLAGRGWRFRTQSDIEVLLKAWREWGAGMFAHLNGMFAFALYDQRKKKLWLARDIAGEKPLYYYRNGRTFAFCSEAKALSGLVPLEPRQDAFFEAFQHCHLTTLWKHVYAVPPAHVLMYDLRAHQMTIREYWKFEPRQIRQASAVEELEALLEDAVRLRLRSDVPVGLYYSGGIDSSLISTYHHFNHRFFFDDTRNWRVDFFKRLPLLAFHLDFPVGSLSSYPLWRLAERASHKVKVVLSGEGADEIFGGYVRYMPIARQWALEERYPSYQYIFRKYYPDLLDGFAKITARNDDVDLVRSYLAPYFKMFEDPINAMGFADFKLILPSLLQMGDRMAGAFGLENRCPFLDRRIIEFGFSLPPELKITGLDQKVILRRVLKKRGLSAPLRDEKKGLTIRFNRWLGRKDWDRSTYVQLLIREWQKCFGTSLRTQKVI